MKHVTYSGYGNVYFFDRFFQARGIGMHFNGGVFFDFLALLIPLLSAIPKTIAQCNIKRNVCQPLIKKNMFVYLIRRRLFQFSTFPHSRRERSEPMLIIVESGECFVPKVLRINHTNIM